MNPTPAAQGPPPGEGKRALVLAAYGSYIATIYILISRLDSSGVTGLFLINSGLHAAVAMVLGFVAGDFGIFWAITNTGNQSGLLYFLLGMFPFWAIDWLKQKAISMFQVPQESGCANVALCLVDGLDDPIIDRLTENGIWNIQHLVAAEPMEVSARTLYPLSRVLDWIDQAILISFFRSEIVHCRELGIRGATHLASTYGESVGYVLTLLNVINQQDNSKSLLDTLATRTNVSRSTIDLIGRRLFYDRQVRLALAWRQVVQPPIHTRLLVEAVLGAIREAAQGANVKFNPAPSLGQPVSPPIGQQPASPPYGGYPTLEQLLPSALDRALRRHGYRWAGSFADIANLTSWNEIVNEILNRTLIDQFRPQLSSPPASPP